ncbi:MAG: hypothetical protein CM15mP12_2230 [Gammaproteobacteria bacterium]|nr:MAG: hypothetical protein CM15mP12_2230 [Gammaproteobacteria bacterium]
MCGDPSKEMWSEKIPNVNQIIIFGKHAKGKTVHWLKVKIKFVLNLWTL